MADYGLKISQEGFDVFTCEDKDLVMNYDINLLKTSAVGVKSPAGNVAHGLSYTPLFFTTRPFSTSGRYSLIGDDLSTCDGTNLTTAVNNTKYYIFYEQGT